MNYILRESLVKRMVKALTKEDYLSIAYIGGRMNMPIRHIDCLIWRWGLKLQPWRNLRRMSYLGWHSEKYQRLLRWDGFPVGLRPETYHIQKVRLCIV